MLYASIGAWTAACLLVGGLLLGRHLLTLPTPASDDPALRAALHAHRRPDEQGWLVLHVLYDGCGCSVRVLDHLLATPRPPGVHERVLYVTEDGAPAGLARRLAAHGIALELATPEQLVARYHLEVAPLLVILDARDRVRYLGGYTPRKQASDVRELGVIMATRLGWPVTPLPTFGCAVSSSLRSRLDPLE